MVAGGIVALAVQGRGRVFRQGPSAGAGASAPPAPAFANPVVDPATGKSRASFEGRL